MTVPPADRRVPAPGRTPPLGNRDGYADRNRYPDRPADRPEIERADVEAVLATHRELGPDLEDALVESFTDRVERAIDRRVDRELAERDGSGRDPVPAERSGDGRLTLAIVSIACGVPITAIAAGIAGLPALLIVWVAIVAVNVAYRGHPGDPRRR